MAERATLAEQSGGDRADDEAAIRFFEDVGMSRYLPAGVSADDAVAVILCTLLRRVTGGLARDFVGIMPSALRTVLGSCAERRTETPEGFNRDMYLRRVSMLLGTTEEVAERLARDIFLAMHRHLSRVGVDDVAGQLPEDLERMWSNP